MAYDRLKKRLDDGQSVILDGAMGTELQRRGIRLAWTRPRGAARLRFIERQSRAHTQH
jgi:S-methylmethionine-dependent homocysteine/selenocysteine methylase